MQYEFELGSISIDVGELVRRNVASLYSHLVTRPTGRAVRMAIEAQLDEVRGASLSLIDLSEVTVLDFSCADEVVAKLLLRYGDERSSDEAFFLFRGLKPPHRDPIQAVLERQSLVAVAEIQGGGFELLGIPTPAESTVWRRLEDHGAVPTGRVREVFPDGHELNILEGLARRRLVYRGGETGSNVASYIALSRLVKDVPERG